MKNEQKAPPCPQKFSWRLQPEGGEKKKKKKKVITNKIYLPES